ncbi:2-oxoacid:acceptor oxidoreductase family protein [Pseudodesulfovibrio thermohalotolerans]|uniref:2-oxoacid:acceptor oxidoreductase family protein n=1 Tax=Pseudodesulfovibrio thermohalotolerans TaxID=2880651 RepID=UPI0022B9E8C7|nr:2-oxoacid:acceptor oxidoreductase family protein [Pseudodesulfovibrio thermohalotolerans]WFS63115.1 2-oxoacid:acceptor oxidoreductase family protein [Pseudodesulfovibrio thermohalotolerans]
MLRKCMFSGSGGQGSALMAKMVCLGAIKENLKVVMTQTYGIEQRGGDSTAFVIVSDEAIGSPIVENDADIAVALSQSIYENCFEGVVPGGKLFTNSSMVEKSSEADGFNQVFLPASDTAVELGTVRCANMVMLGGVLAGTGLLKLETVEEVVRETMGSKKPQLVDLNINALRTGYDAVKKEMDNE